MPTARRRGILAAVTALVLLAMGLGVGLAVGDALGIRTEPSTQMEPADPVVPAISQPVVPPAFTTIDAPGTARISAALDELSAATADAPGTSGEASLTVVAGEGDASDDSYTLSGDPTTLRIDAK